MIADNLKVVLRETANELEQINFGLDLKLQNEIDSSITKALSNQDDLLRKLTEEIRGLEDETDQALSNEEVKFLRNIYNSMKFLYLNSFLYPRFAPAIINKLNFRNRWKKIK